MDETLTPTPTTVSNELLINLLDNLIRCPITTCIYSNPVVASDRFIYDAHIIRRVIRETSRSPLTSKKLKPTVIAIPLIRNITLDLVKLFPTLKSECIVERLDYKDHMEQVSEHLAERNFQELLRYKGFILGNGLSYGSFVDIFFRTCADEDIQLYVIKNLADPATCIKRYLNYITFYCKSLSVFKYIKEDLNITLDNGPDPGGRHPIHYAAQNSPANIVQYFVESGVSIDTKDINGDIPLHHCSNNTNVNTVKYLIAKTEDINKLDSAGRHILFKLVNESKLSVKKELNEVILMLLQDRCIDVNIKNNEDMNLLHVLFQRNMIDIIRELIHKFPNLECETKQGWRPIHYACRYGTVDAIDLLISKNVKLNAQTKPLHDDGDPHQPIHLLEMNPNLDQSSRETFMDLIIAITTSYPPEKQ
jgi:ankyrin repeat protein